MENNIKKKKGIALLFSFFMPGMGNLYGREIKKALLIYLTLMAVNFGFKYLSFDIYWLGIFLLGGLLLKIWSLIEGFRSVNQDKAYEPVSYDKWYVYLMLFAGHLILMNLLLYSKLPGDSMISMANAPTSSMSSTIMTGDMFVYNSNRNILHGDVTVFMYPNDPETRYVKRCVGLPGDTVTISYGKLILNSDTLKDYAEYDFLYLVTSDKTLGKRFLEENKIIEYSLHNDGRYVMFITQKQAEKLSGYDFIKQVDKVQREPSAFDPGTFPVSTLFNWNADHYGPLYIPAKGRKIKLTEKNIATYSQYILKETPDAEHKPAGIYINDKKAEYYTFKENYYFMMGDSRHNSLDSRYFGFVSEILLRGQVMYLYWSRDMERIGKKIN